MKSFWQVLMVVVLGLLPIAITAAQEATPEATPDAAAEEVLVLAPETAQLTLLADGVPVDNTFSAEMTMQLYAFLGSAGDRVSVNDGSADAAAGSVHHRVGRAWPRVGLRR